MTRPNGAVVYHGPSMINGAPIVAVLTGLERPSANPKTGDMLQLWIMSAAALPLDASQTGEDAAVCGGCKHRPKFGGTCYVSLFQGPRAVWTVWNNGDYLDTAPDDIAQLVKDRLVRLGAYGDPAAVPEDIIRKLADAAKGHTGYTHQWAAPSFRWLQDICQASVDSLPEYHKAVSQGWATFRVRPVGETVPQANEFNCPASEEGGKRTNCADCLACNGTGKHIVITAHGATAKRFNGTQKGS